LLVALEYFTGVSAVVGGLMLATRPDGSLLQAKLSALSRSPFDDWRVPGVLLAVLVGGGFLVAAEWQRRRLPGARELSILAGVGLITFEVAELAWIGFQPLEIIFGVVGAAVIVLAIRESGSSVRGEVDRRQGASKDVTRHHWVSMDEEWRKSRS
jgi:hypothetical protein